MSHALLKRYPSLYDLVYISSYLYESAAFQQLHYQDPTPPWSAMSRMYLTATDEDFIWRQGLSPANSRTAERMLITTPFMLSPDNPMLLLCIRNRKPDARSPWYAERFIPRSEFERAGQFAGIPEGEWLRNWAIIRLGEPHDYFGALQELAKMTHPGEHWYFGLDEDRHFPILGNFLRYTFYKLWLDQAICYSADGQMASFNTGLVNSRYEYIYAVFEHIQPQNGKFWSLKGFCIAGEQGLGKEFLRQFNPIPKPARFFRRTSELIYEIDYDLSLEQQMPYVDYNHIIHDNLRRFPLSFLRNICFGYQEIQQLLDQIPKADSAPTLDQLWEQIDRKVDNELFIRIKAQMERAVRMGVQRAIWNYKTAIPVYFPARDALSWLLPLALTPGSQADVALVVERFPNGNLEGHTVLDLDMAYTNARLVSKPESDWLSPAIIEMGLETRMEIQNEQPSSSSNEPGAIPALDNDPPQGKGSPAKNTKEAAKDVKIPSKTKSAQQPNRLDEGTVSPNKSKSNRRKTRRKPSSTTVLQAAAAFQETVTGQVSDIAETVAILPQKSTSKTFKPDGKKRNVPAERPPALVDQEKAAASQKKNSSKTSKADGKKGNVPAERPPALVDQEKAAASQKKPLKKSKETGKKRKGQTPLFSSPDACAGKAADFQKEAATQPLNAPEKTATVQAEPSVHSLHRDKQTSSLPKALEILNRQRGLSASQARSKKTSAPTNEFQESAIDHNNTVSEKQTDLSPTLIGKTVLLDQIKLRKGRQGIEGVYKGIRVTVSPSAMQQPAESYLGKKVSVKILRINPQKTQYIGKVVEQGEEKI